MNLNRVLFVLLALTLLAAPGFAYTLSGSISGAQFLGGISYVWAFQVDTLNLTPSVGLALLGNGTYWIFNVPTGSYILFAFQDRDGNLIPSVDDRIGFYGDSLPAVVQVTGNTQNLDIALSPLPVTGISGAITCPTGPTGITFVQAATDQAFTNVVRTAFLMDLTGNGTYSLYVDPGQYYVRTFLDADFSFDPSPGDPQSYWGYPNNLQLVNVTSHAATDVNMTLNLPPDATLTMTPQGAPIIIPPGGGNFSYSVAISNGPTPLSTKIWFDVTLPNGSTQPLLGPIALNLPAGFTGSRVRVQNVPAAAPPGNYSYKCYLGVYPAIVWLEGSFPFTKSGSGDWGLGVGDWSCSGEPFPEEEAISYQPTASRLIGASPNPFNPTTVLSFDLRVTSQVSLKLYDAAGRLVALLVNGWREAGPHEVTFDGSALASGMYFVRMQTGEFSTVRKIMLVK